MDTPETKDLHDEDTTQGGVTPELAQEQPAPNEKMSEQDIGWLILEDMESTDFKDFIKFISDHPTDENDIDW